MKRFVSLLMVMMLGLSMVCAAHADPKDYVGQQMRNFLVNTTDGAKFSLSEALETYDLVVVNFWATWCPPCRAEFPYLEKAWEQYKDRVAVIAMTVEKNDVMSSIRSFAKEYGLEFAVARDEGKLFDRMGGRYIPTTFIVGADRKILAVEVGGKSSVKDFTNWFDKYLPKK